MTYVGISCHRCGKKTHKELRRFNEAKKFGWKSYCSRECQISSKHRQQQKVCNNPLCKKLFNRTYSAIYPSGIAYCSVLCAAIVNSQKTRLLRVKTKMCPICKSEFSGRRRFCSSGCERSHLEQILSRKRITSEQILEDIKDFHKANKRIPFKNEYSHNKMARKYFGSWNNAIITAGFTPNPVKFAHKYIADDGHRCDSMAEKIIDDWLYKHKIPHKTKVPYGYKRMTVDFKVKGIFIEFFGLSGELDKYDSLTREKEMFALKNGIELIKIYPYDLFPCNKLDRILHKLNRYN